jgi:acyl-CoA thioester hydrolase
MGHVNNAVYLTYLEMVRLAYWQEVMGARGLGDVAFILADVYIRFASPVVLGEVIDVRIRAVDISRKSFAFEYLLTERSTGRVVAQARSAQVMYDYAAKRSAPISDAQRAKFDAFEGTRPTP